MKVAAEYLNEVFEIGVQFTGVLVEPRKLEAVSIRGMHAGARVVAIRVRPNRIYIEADELDPPARASAHVRLTAEGTLAANDGE